MCYEADFWEQVYGSIDSPRAFIDRISLEISIVNLPKTQMA